MHVTAVLVDANIRRTDSQGVGLSSFLTTMPIDFLADRN